MADQEMQRARPAAQPAASVDSSFSETGFARGVVNLRQEQKKLGAHVDGQTNLSQLSAEEIAGQVAGLLHIKSPESFPKACSKMMDVFLESKAKFSEVLEHLDEKVQDAGQLRNFKLNYLYPSRDAVAAVRGADVAAEHYDFDLSARSLDNLKKLGAEFGLNLRGDVTMRFAPGVTGRANGTDLNLGGGRPLVFDNNTRGVELTETDRGFNLVVHNKVGDPDVIELQHARLVASRPWESPAYVPGTRYAVVSKQDIRAAQPTKD